jgi:hypothetical protein
MLPVDGRPPHSRSSFQVRLDPAHHLVEKRFFDGRTTGEDQKE